MGIRIVDLILTDSYLLQSDSVVFDFIGGEPLLEMQLISNIMEYADSMMRKTNHKWLETYEIRITTNGLLYNGEIVQDFIKKYRHHLSVSISIDGTKNKTNANRVFPNGEGCYDKIIQNIYLWVKQFPEATTKMVISHIDIPYVYESLVHLLELGIYRIDVNPVGQDVWKEGDAKLYEEQLIRFADYVLENGLWQVIDVSAFYEYNGYNDPIYINQNPCGSMMFSVDSKGNFYSCIRFVEFSLNNRHPMIIGNVATGLDYNKLRSFELMYRDVVSPPECLECEINAGCKWCPADAYDAIDGSLFVRKTFGCEMHKAKVHAKNYFYNKLSRIS